MKRIFLLVALLPLISMAQVKVPADQFVITGKVTGFADGTVVDLLNASNGTPEQTTRITNGQFTLTGKQDYPDMKLLSFNKVAPYINIFLDNSQISFTGSKEALDKSVITGSPSHADFVAYATIAGPYEKLFSGQEKADSPTVKKVAALMEDFARKKTNSHIALIAIYRNHQLLANSDLMEELFGKMDQSVRVSPMGNYLAQMIEEARRNPIGKPLPDFSQEDPSGKTVSLSSFKGKYVLIDFWASWCGPCRQENPNLVTAYQKYKNKNFTVLGVSLDKSRQPWLDAIKADNLTWTQVSDLKGWQNSVAQMFQIGSIPQNFLVDPNGIVLAKNLRGADLEKKLASLLK